MATKGSRGRGDRGEDNLDGDNSRWREDDLDGEDNSRRRGWSWQREVNLDGENCLDGEKMIFAGRKPISYSDENALIGYPTFYSNIADFETNILFSALFFPSWTIF